jgi:hypothetical protein
MFNPLLTSRFLVMPTRNMILSMRFFFNTKKSKYESLNTICIQCQTISQFHGKQFMCHDVAQILFQYECTYAHMPAPFQLFYFLTVCIDANTLVYFINIGIFSFLF